MDFEIDHEYPFVRIVDGHPGRAVFIRFEDGSAVVESEEGAPIWEETEDAWESALSDLRSQGYVVDHSSGSGPSGEWPVKPRDPAAPPPRNV